MTDNNMKLQKAFSTFDVTLPDNVLSGQILSVNLLDCSINIMFRDRLLWLWAVMLEAEGNNSAVWLLGGELNSCYQNWRISCVGMLSTNELIIFCNIDLSDNVANIQKALSAFCEDVFLGQECFNE